jgi:hypothetical protein
VGAPRPGTAPGATCGTALVDGAAMMKHLVWIALLACCGGTALAQKPVSGPDDAALQKCLLGTFDGTWTELKLTSDQLERMRRVQSACREECEKAGVKKVDNPISNADGSTVLSEVKNILTKEQYEAWVGHCRENPSGGQLPK